jgi:hypothetical protein
VITAAKPKFFPLGDIVATRGALDALRRAAQPPLLFVLRHLRGDWGELSPADWALNDGAVEDGGRILSAYRTALGERLWVITEADRRASTLLLPDEY